MDARSPGRGETAAARQDRQALLGNGNLFASRPWMGRLLFRLLRPVPVSPVFVALASFVMGFYLVVEGAHRARAVAQRHRT